MRLLLFLVLAMANAQAEELSISGLSFNMPSGSPSCGLLKHRELEREKVLRELDFLRQAHAQGDSSSLLLANSLLVNKFFLDRATWADETVQVAYRAEIPEALAAEIERVGLYGIFLKFYGPGLTWQSYAGQLPDDLTLEYDRASRTLLVGYPIYQVAFCLETPITPTLEWIQRESLKVTPLPNTAEQVASLQSALDQE